MTLSSQKKLDHCSAQLIFEQTNIPTLSYFFAKAATSKHDKTTCPLYRLNREVELCSQNKDFCYMCHWGK